MSPCVIPSSVRCVSAPDDQLPDHYLTVARNAVAEIEVKRSRFLATLERVEDEAAAREVVARMRKEHWDARHHCSAFVIGPRGEVQRSSDDGEPSGTAGAPMLDVLRGAEVSDVVVVVTRWFGGTLLGAGGLVRAYSDATREALAAAGTRTRRRLVEYTLELEHADAARVESQLRQRNYDVLGVDYAARATINLAVPPTAPFERDVAELTAGSAHPVRGPSRWV